jgi:hypothetical protein
MPTVNDIYQQVLGRPAEPEGLAYWKSVFGDYVDDTELAQFKTAAAPEIAQRALLTGAGNTAATTAATAATTAATATTAAPTTVADLYQQVLGRAPESQAVVDEWTRLFGSTIEPAEIEQFKQAAQLELTNSNVSNIKGQILAQGNIDKWTGQGQGSAEANATDMANILAGIGITDISQFGALPGGGFGNKVTGQAVPNTYGERQTGNAFGGTFAGKGNTGYRVNFDPTGNPIFYTTSASSSDVPTWVKAALIAGGAYLGLDAAGLLTASGTAGTTGLTLAELGGTAGATTLTAAETAALYGTGGALAGTLPAATAAATAATGLTTAQIAQLASAGLSAAQIGSLVSGGLTTGAGLLQQQTSREAAVAAQAMIEKETAAAKLAAQFRPIGMTTKFGTSNFAFDPATGRLIDANYNLSPEAKAQQDRLTALANAGLTQAEGAQAQFAPLETGAKSLFKLGQGYLDATTDPAFATIAKQYLPLSQESKDLTKLGTGYLALSQQSKDLTSLGSKYIAKTPEDVAKDYLSSQLALLTPGREIELANLQNRLQQQGRGGLAVAQGGALGATTPELQALYNARAQQEAQLAANAQQAGQQQVQFGAGLIGTGQQLGIQGQQFGANLLGTGQQLGIAGQQFGMNTLAAQQALEQQRLAFGSGLLSQGSGLLGQYYAGQQAAYAPYTTAMGQVQALETAAQQPFNTSLALAQQQAKAGYDVGQLGLAGAKLSTALSTGTAATTNPYSTALGGLAASPAFGQYIGGLFGGVPSTTAMSALPTSFGTGNYYGSQDLGLYF